MDFIPGGEEPKFALRLLIPLPRLIFCNTEKLLFTHRRAHANTCTQGWQSSQAFIVGAVGANEINIF